MNISNTTAAPLGKRALDTASQQPTAKKPCTSDTRQAVQKWTTEEDKQLQAAIDKFGARNWKNVAGLVHGRTHAQCLQRWAKVLKPGLKKGQWTTDEDIHLTGLVQGGWKNWTAMADQIPGRTSKQCRERWFHHLDPSINRSAFSEEEDKMILAVYDAYGSRWAETARKLKTGRTGEAVKIRYKTLNRHRQAGHTTRCPQVTRCRQYSYNTTSAVVATPVQKSPRSVAIKQELPSKANAKNEELNWINDMLSEMEDKQETEPLWDNIDDSLDIDEIIGEVEKQEEQRKIAVDMDFLDFVEQLEGHVATTPTSCAFEAALDVNSGNDLASLFATIDAL